MASAPPAPAATSSRPAASAAEKALAKLGLLRDIDLALHLPLRYEDETRVVPIAELRDGQTGLVVAPGDPEALAAAINRLLDDAELRERLGAAARQAVAPYTYEAMADGIGRALAAAGVH